jgi:hypothetical protein
MERKMWLSSARSRGEAGEFCPDTGARASHRVLTYRKYVPGVDAKPGLGLGANLLGFSYVGIAVFSLGFGIWDLGFGIWDLGFGIWDLGFG